MRLVNEMSTFILSFLWISNTRYVFTSSVNGELETRVSLSEHIRIVRWFFET